MLKIRGVIEDANKNLLNGSPRPQSRRQERRAKTYNLDIVDIILPV